MEITIREPDASETDEPRFEPREPYRRTLCQWWVWLQYKTGYLKKDAYGSYSCDVCGWYTLNDYPQSSMLNMTRPERNSYYSYEFGVTGYDWDEEHQCEDCGSVFGFSNSSC